MFAERGYSLTSTRAVAERAGVSEGLIFHHFGSKAGLLRALTQETEPSRLLAAFERARELPLDRVPAHLAAAWRSAANDAGIVASLARDATKDPEVREIVAGVVGHTLASLSALLRERVAAGELRAELDVPLAAALLQQILLGYSVARSVVARGPSLSRQLELVFSGWRT